MTAEPTREQLEIDCKRVLAMTAPYETQFRVARALLTRLDLEAREPRQYHTFNCASVAKKGTSIMCDCGAVQTAGDP